MRRALLIVCASLLCAAPAASAQGGSADCTKPFLINQKQQLDGLTLEPGDYKITTLETGSLTCDAAEDNLREILRERGDALPAGWRLEHPSRPSPARTVRIASG